MLPMKPHQTPNQFTNLNLFNNCEVYYEINIFKQTNKQINKQTKPKKNPTQHKTILKLSLDKKMA